MEPIKLNEEWEMKTRNFHEEWKSKYQRTNTFKFIIKLQKKPREKSEEEVAWRETCQFIRRVKDYFNNLHIELKSFTKQNIFKFIIKKLRGDLISVGLYNANLHELIINTSKLIRLKIKKSEEFIKKFIYSRSYGIGKIRELAIKCRMSIEAKIVRNKIYEGELSILSKILSEKYSEIHGIQVDLINTLRNIIKSKKKNSKNHKIKKNTENGDQCINSGFLSSEITYLTEEINSKFYQRVIFRFQLILIMSLLDWKFFRKKLLL